MTIRKQPLWNISQPVQLKIELKAPQTSSHRYWDLISVNNWVDLWSVRPPAGRAGMGQSRCAASTLEAAFGCMCPIIHLHQQPAALQWGCLCITPRWPRRRGGISRNILLTCLFSINPSGGLIINVRILLQQLGGVWCAASPVWPPPSWTPGRSWLWFVSPTAGNMKNQKRKPKNK